MLALLAIGVVTAGAAGLFKPVEDSLNRWDRNRLVAAVDRNYKTRLKAEATARERDRVRLEQRGYRG